MIEDVMTWCQVNREDSARCFVDWTNTNAHVVLRCACGQRQEHTGDKLHFWQCAGCGGVWQMGVEVKMVRVGDGDQSEDRFGAQHPEPIPSDQTKDTP